MNSDSIKAKYVWSSDPEIRRSTSAGAFYLIAREFIKEYNKQAVVYGCAFDDNNNAIHIRVRKIEELKILQGSKYVQSDMTQIFPKLINDLKEGKYVLFSGTACQTAAANSFAANYGERLYTVDVLCHGVPSPMLWKIYVSELEKKYRGKVSDIRFRNKSSRNRLGYMLKFKVNGIEKTVFPNESWYYTSFFQSASLRPSCYKCAFVGGVHCSDITIGDSNTKQFHSTEAVSLLLIKNMKGWFMYNLIVNIVENMDADLEAESRLNKKLVEPSRFPQGRLQFYKTDLYEKKNENNYRRWVLNRIKNLLPTWIKDFINR